DAVMDIDAGLSYTQNEISMTVVPGSGNLVAAYNDEPYPGGPGIGISYSPDNGTTWNARQLIIPTSTITGLLLLDAFDPTVDSDASGNVFAAHISTDFNWGSGPESGLFVHKSPDGGVNWALPVNVDAEPGAVTSPDPGFRFNDRCQIRVDKNPSSPYFNYVYLVWIKDRGWNMPTPDSDIYVSVSTDAGGTFSAAQQINTLSNSMGNMPIQAIASNGDVYVLWLDYNVITGGNGVMLLDKSTDGGLTWGNDVVVNTIPLPPINLNGGTDARAKGAAVLRTDPANPNGLYIVYAADPDGLGADEADIFFIKSLNGGASWSSPLQLNDDVTTNDQVLPWMEVKSNGIIDVVWYDRRNDPADLLWDVYATSSTDGGASFAVNSKVSTTSFATPQTKSGRWFGEYLGLVVSGTTAYIGFTSSAIDTKGDVLFTSFTNPATSAAPGSLDPESFEHRIYPNPTGDIIYVNAGDLSNLQIEVFNETGELVIYKTADRQITVLDLGDHPSGIYLIRLTNEEGSRTQKVVKQ
ncbi:MAG: T9SS type A sorting domain-containing protein, partial [Bacteroidetes bacterium]|nr:T9SS type A sorting domain-containing protein [Bacteroidota bacterium]